MANADLQLIKFDPEKIFADEQDQQAVEQGKSWIEGMKLILPLDYSPESLRALQKHMVTLEEHELSAAGIGAAVYLAEVINRAAPEYAYVCKTFLYEGEGNEVEEITLFCSPGVALNLYSWVVKATITPEDDDLVYKFNQALKKLRLAAIAREHDDE